MKWQQVDFALTYLVQESSGCFNIGNTVVKTWDDRHSQHHAPRPACVRNPADVVEYEFVRYPRALQVLAGIHVFNIDEEPLDVRQDSLQQVSANIATGLHADCDICIVTALQAAREQTPLALAAPRRSE